MDDHTRKDKGISRREFRRENRHQEIKRLKKKREDAQEKRKQALDQVAELRARIDQTLQQVKEWEAEKEQFLKRSKNLQDRLDEISSRIKKLEKRRGALLWAGAAAIMAVGWFTWLVMTNLASSPSEPGSPSTATNNPATTQWLPCSTYAEYLEAAESGRGPCWEPVPGGPGIMPAAIWHPLCDWKVYDHLSKRAALASARAHWATWSDGKYADLIRPYLDAAEAAPCGETPTTQTTTVDNFANMREAAGATTTRARATTTTLSREVLEAAFELSVRDYVEGAGASMAAAKNLARGICSDFDDGLTLAEVHAQIVAVALEQEWDEPMIELAGIVTGAGTLAFCPEHEWRLEE